MCVCLHRFSVFKHVYEAGCVTWDHHLGLYWSLRSTEAKRGLTWTERELIWPTLPNAEGQMCRWALEPLNQRFEGNQDAPSIPSLTFHKSAFFSGTSILCTAETRHPAASKPHPLPALGLQSKKKSQGKVVIGSSTDQSTGPAGWAALIGSTWVKISPGPNQLPWPQAEGMV